MESISKSNYGIPQIIKENKAFFVPYAIIIGISTIVLAILGNTTLFHFINQHHSKLTDFLFFGFTILGDGTTAFLIIFILMWISMREAITLLVITLLITIIIALLKRFIFAEYDRPLMFFGEQMIRIVPGYMPPKLHTFPSGHSATAFSTYLYVSFLVRQNGLKFSLFLIAFMIAYSRVYLSAHFPADVIAGSLLAVSITILVYLYFQRIKFSWIDRKIVFNPFRIPREQTA
jgi:membrane-associated phospholipid phosphatase